MLAQVTCALLSSSNASTAHRNVFLAQLEISLYPDVPLRVSVSDKADVHAHCGKFLRPGAISALRHGTADISAFPFTASYEPQFDQTVSVYNVGLRLLIKETEEQSGDDQ